MSVFFIDQPGHVLRMPDVILPYDYDTHTGYNGGQSIAFSRDGHKAFYNTNYHDDTVTATIAGKTADLILDFMDIQVLSVLGAGQVSHIGTVRTPTRRGTSQLFGVDCLATSPDGNYLFFTNPTISGASPVIDVISIPGMSVVKQIGTPLDYPDPDKDATPDPDDTIDAVLPAGIVFPESPINLGLSLDLGGGKATPDEEFVFQVVVNNLSTTYACNIQIASGLPEGLEIVSASPSLGSWNAGSNTWSIPEMSRWTTASLTVTAICSETGDKLLEFFVDRQAGYDPDSTNDSVQGTIRVVGKADLAIAGEVSSATPIVSSPFTVSLTAGNAGPLAGVNVTVSQPLPDGWTVVSSSGSGSYDKTTGLWTIGALPVGGSASLQLTLQSSVLGSTVLTFPIGDSDSYDPKESDNELALAVQIVKVAPPLQVALQRLENDLVFTKELFNKLTWQHNPANTNVSGYKILFKLKSAADSSYSQLTVTAASATQYAHRNLAAGQSYSYKIIAVNTSGDESPAVVVEN